MIKKVPRVILRADLIKPRDLPAMVMYAFDRIGNQILPRLGVNMYLELFSAGWIFFFSSYSDFRTYFTKLLIKRKLQIEETSRATSNAGNTPIVWEYTFERLPPNLPEEKLVKILREFYTTSEILGEATFQEIRSPGCKTRYRVTRPSIASFLTSLDEVLRRVHDILIKSQK